MYAFRQYTALKMTAQYLNNDTETRSEEVDSGMPQPFPPYLLNISPCSSNNGQFKQFMNVLKQKSISIVNSK